MELSTLSKQYFQNLEDNINRNNSSCFEGFLHKAQTLFPYSVRNVGLILTQNPNAMKVHGMDEWKKQGASVKFGAKSIQIYAPTKTKEGQEFCITNVIDISDTSAKYFAPQKVDVEKVLLFVNTIAQKNFGFKLAYTEFKSTYKKITYLDWKNRVIYLKKEANPLFQAWMALKDLILIYQQDQIVKGKRAIQGQEYAKAIALSSAFEVLDYLGCNPPLIPSKAKNLIMADKNVKFVDKLKDVHKLASDMIRKIEALRTKKE